MMAILLAFFLSSCAVFKAAEETAKAALGTAKMAGESVALDDLGKAHRKILALRRQLEADRDKLFRCRQETAKKKECDALESRIKNLRKELWNRLKKIRRPKR